MYHPRMAKRFIEYLIDDLTGAELVPGDGETVRFGYLGKEYEIDLGADTAEALADFLAPYVKAARSTNEPPKAKPKSAKSHAPNPKNAKIRAWAAESGIALPATGRIPADVVAAYDKANA
jgi:Lsr2